MDIEIKKMQTDEEKKGKAFVYWRSWHTAYPGLVNREYLDRLTLEKCEEIAFKRPDNILVAKSNGQVSSICKTNIAQLSISLQTKENDIFRFAGAATDVTFVFSYPGNCTFVRSYT